MQLRAGRLADMVRDAVEHESAITCHSTLYRQAPQEGVCRGFFDRHPTLPLRLAVVMDVIEWVEPPTKET
jgi:hypothetical protein